MVSRILVTAVLLVGALVPATLATGRDKASIRQSAIVTFERPTWVAGEMLVGTYVIVHDEDKMTRGEPCTTLYRVGAHNRPVDEVVSFRCIPHERKVATSFTTTVILNPPLRIDAFDTLTEFQFAGDSEGHGVPVPTLVFGRPHVRDSVVCVR